jgi:hypothetical protein
MCQAIARPGSRLHGCVVAEPGEGRLSPVIVSCPDFGVTRSGDAQRPAQALGPAGGTGCPGLGAELAGQALLLSLDEHVAVAVAGDLAAEVGVGEHGLLLFARACGMLPAGEPQVARPAITQGRGRITPSGQRGSTTHGGRGPAMASGWAG